MASLMNVGESKYTPGMVVDWSRQLSELVGEGPVVADGCECVDTTGEGFKFDGAVKCAKGEDTFPLHSCEVYTAEVAACGVEWARRIPEPAGGCSSGACQRFCEGALAALVGSSFGAPSLNFGPLKLKYSKVA